MERAIALKKLGKLLGKGFRYRINPKAPTREEREAAKAEAPEANAKREQLSKQLDARRAALLQGDPEYQALHAAHHAARKHSTELLGLLHSYKFTVGHIIGSMFFSVKAAGDSWEEVIAKLEAKKKAPQRTGPSDQAGEEKQRKVSG